MHILYLLALLPVAFGAVMWILNKKIEWYEWLGGTVLAFLVAGITHLVAINGITSDIETHSGQIVRAVRIPEWQEYYEEAIYRTEWRTRTVTRTRTVNGKSQTYTDTERYSVRVFDHWAPRRRKHQERHTLYSNIDTEYPVSAAVYNELVEKFGGASAITAVAGMRHTSEHASKMISGDPMDYIAHNKSGWVQPVTALRRWENRLKAGPSIFSYEKVPEGVQVYDWPKNDNPFASERLIGNTSIDRLLFDQMNARLGPTKKVNVILINFGDQSSQIAQYQEAAWFGGKKNDLVLCYGGKKHTKADWVRVFGWTDSNIAKRNLESILLKYPINNDILPLIEKEISSNYTIKNWHEFDYIDIEPTTATYVWYIIFMVITQTGFYIYAHKNEFVKGGQINKYRHRYSTRY